MFEFEILTFLQGLNDLEYKKPKEKTLIEDAELHSWRVFRKLPKSRGGGPFRNFWVGMCRWDPGTLDLYQS